MVPQCMVLCSLSRIPFNGVYRFRMVDVALATEIVRSRGLEDFSFPLIGRAPELVNDGLQFGEEVNEL